MGIARDDHVPTLRHVPCCVRGMDPETEQTPTARPTGPEHIAPPTPKPDVGAQRDLVHPDQPDATTPKKPMSDMDPAGQDPDEGEPT